MAEPTPMMAQYRRIKERHTGSILFFRLGDFYEMFDADAREASALLDLTLTQRAGVPMCGIPYHAATSYIARLLAAGRKVAICEQTTPPGRGLMQRDVLEVITPGTVLDEGFLSRGANNYLVCIARAAETVALAYVDLSTGELAATSFSFEQRESVLRKELHRLDPREVITAESLLVEDPVIRDLLGQREGLLVNRYPEWSFDAETCRSRLERQLGVANLKGFGLSEQSTEVLAAGVLLDYVGETARHTLRHVSSLQIYGERSFVGLDEATQRNLELLTNLQDGSRKYTLLEVLDQTRTSPGARKLRRWILAPLLRREEIEERLTAVDALYRDQLLLSKLRELLSASLDLERLTARLAMERAHAKDLLAIRATLQSALSMGPLLSGTAPPDDRHPLRAVVAPLARNRDRMREAAELLDRAICDEPAITLTDGNLIRRGYDAELDRLHELAGSARTILDAYLTEERAATGISSLKLRYNKVFGYSFEVSKANLPHVPPHFIRRQSLVGGERYTTDRLSDLESQINDASERIVEVERTLFLAVRARVAEAVPWLLEVSGAISELDVYQSLAFAATLHGYARPTVVDAAELDIRDGRHPVVEAHLPGGAFVPNSLSCRGDEKFFVILTGPNMAGKSTYLRQVALITLMAQIGSFVPAADARIGVADSIFCRVGATDNLARGESTFLVEMNETAHILRSATPRSLVIMDEIGRGTSTRDGLAIAWAVCLYILEHVRCRTLFATHFHELTALSHDAVSNLSMDVQEHAGEVVFLKRVREGPSSNSYGIHVARLAGLPAETLAYAERLMAEGIPQAAVLPTDAPPSPGPPSNAGRVARSQAGLFPVEELIAREILGTSLDRMTPLEALNRIARWREELSHERDKA
ncbi:MAG TPA: DNA mismatch repair protein MutS [Spirochaetia bacterium]|nr:DNA mismatch repair protein MutS [Spirochaetia bacterium]